MLSEIPSANHIAAAYLTRLTNLLYEASKGLRNAARNSIGSIMPAKSLEFKHTIRLMSELDAEVKEIEEAIKNIMDEINSPILSIPGISYRMGAMIIAEIGDFERLSSPDKILAYAGLSPSTYQSGQLISIYSHKKKRFPLLKICFIQCSQPLLNTSTRNEMRASITMLQYLTQQRNW